MLHSFKDKSGRSPLIPVRVAGAVVDVDVPPAVSAIVAVAATQRHTDAPLAEEPESVSCIPCFFLFYVGAKAPTPPLRGVIKKGRSPQIPGRVAGAEVDDDVPPAESAKVAVAATQRHTDALLVLIKIITLKS